MRFLFILSFFLLSCADDSSSLPKEIIAPNRMEAVLYDVITADELADFSVMQDSTFRLLSKRTSIYDSIFQAHSITKEGFKKSLKFYQGRPDLLKTILDSLQRKSDSAIAWQTRADTTNAQKKRRDTVRKDTVKKDSSKLKPVKNL